MSLFAATPMDDLVHGQPGVTMNFVMCAALFVACLVTLIRLERRYARHTATRFVYRAYREFTTAIGIWCVYWFMKLFVLPAVVNGTEVDERWGFLELALSDLNTLYMYLVYRHISRGEHGRPVSFRRRLFAAVLAIELIAYALTFLAGLKQLHVIHRYWSLSLSTIAPFLVGLGFHLRYQRSSVIIVALLYGALQAPSYVFLPDPVRGGEFFLWLAVAKLAFWWAMTLQCFEKPTESASLIRPASPAASSGWRRHLLVALPGFVTLSAAIGAYAFGTRDWGIGLAYLGYAAATLAGLAIIVRGAQLARDFGASKRLAAAGSPHASAVDADASVPPGQLEELDAGLRAAARRMAPLYEVFFCVEQSLRGFVRRQLTRVHGESWWSFVVPDVADRAKKAHDKERAAAHTERSEDLLDYVCFGELTKIVEHRWRDFASLITDRNGFTKTMNVLNQLRSPIMHCCRLPDDEVDRLSLAIRDIERIVRFDATGPRSERSPDHPHGRPRATLSDARPKGRALR